MGGELADLASCVEGNAQLLCESIGDPVQVAEQAELLWAAVGRLRLFSEKILTSARTPPLEPTPVNLRTLLVSVRHELQDHAIDGLQVKSASDATLPQALADADALRKVLLFLVQSMLKREPNACVLGLRARCASDTTVELLVEVESESAQVDRSRSSAPLGEVAARRLLAALGGQLDLEHDLGRRCSARILLQAVPADLTSPAPAPTTVMTAHPFGGVLVLEDDPAIRSMVKREIAKTRRRVVCCADGAAAQSLFHATPERFELLILEVESRGERGTKIAAEALSTSPEARVLFLAGDALEGEEVPAGPMDRCRVLRKPFGVLELRQAVGALLGPGSPTAIH